MRRSSSTSRAGRCETRVRLIRAVLDIAAKDLRQRVRDRSLLLIAIVAPFTLAVLFSVMLGGVDQGFNADWAVVDLDDGETGSALLDGPINGIEAAGVVDITMFTDVDAAREAVEDGRVDTALIIPAGLSAGVASGLGGTIELVSDPDATISGSLARSVLAGFGSRINAIGTSVSTALAEAGQLPDAAAIEALTEQARALPAAVVVVDDAADDRSSSISTYYAGAMAIMFVFLGAQFGVTSLLREKRNGTLVRMVAAPIKPITIVVGKAVVSMIIAVVSMTVMVAGTAVLLGARWGDPVALALLVLAAAMAATGIALLAVGFARSEDQAGSAVAIATITLAVLGGAFFPVAQGPGILTQLSLLSPHHWFLSGVADISTGGDASTAALAIGVLALIGLISGGVGLWRAGRVVTS